MSSERPNPKIEEERKAAESAKAVLGWLTPKSARTDRIIFILRYAANLAATAVMIRGLESKKALDDTREESTRSLNEVCSLLQKRIFFTQDAIDQANRAVGAWLSALIAGGRPSS